MAVGSVNNYDVNRLEYLRKIIQDTQQAGIELKLLIAPVHAIHLQGLQAIDRWGEFEQWKRDLVKLIEEEGFQAAVPLYDFATYGVLNKERLPPPNDRTLMQFWWDNSHAKPSLGNLVLYHLFGQSDPKQPVPDTFGPRLTVEGIEAHLQAQRDASAEYSQNYPEEVQMVQEALERILNRQEANQ